MSTGWCTILLQALRSPALIRNPGMAGANQHQFISPATINTFLTPDAFGHTGFTGTSISVVPLYHLSVIILINRQNTGLQPTGLYYNPNPVRQGVFAAARRQNAKQFSNLRC